VKYIRSEAIRALGELSHLEALRRLESEVVADPVLARSYFECLQQVCWRRQSRGALFAGNG
jgi:hypothetical protein